MADHPHGDVAAVGALAEPVRRQLYDAVCARPEGVTRGEAASAAGVADHSARFHLDRLVDEGLLVADYRRPEGRGGPGAGRPAKRYRRAGREVVVTLPARSYGVASSLLAAAVDRALAGEPLSAALAEEARSAGHAVGAAYEGPRGTAELDLVERMLNGEGYEPAREDGSVIVRNCPFDALAQRHPALVCGLNVDYVTGLVEGGGCDLAVRLDPGEDRCCVRVAVPDV